MCNAVYVIVTSTSRTIIITSPACTYSLIGQLTRTQSLRKMSSGGHSTLFKDEINFI